MPETEKMISYSELNNGISPEKELEGVVAKMKATKNPANRIYEAMIQQIDLLRFDFRRRKDAPIKDRDAANLKEKYATVNKLAEFYFKSKDNKPSLSEEEKQQMESVNTVREVMISQTKFVDKVMAQNGPAKGTAAKDTGSVDEKSSQKNAEGMDYSEAIKKSSEAAFSAVRELGTLGAGKNGAKEFTETEKDLTRLGMTAIMLYDRIMSGEEGQKFFENYVKPQKDYGKVITSIANSPEFKKIAESKYSAEGVKEFLAQKDAPKKLWENLEESIKKPKEMKAKEEVKEKTEHKEKATGFAL